MQHHFNIEIAERYGILEAVLLENLKFWIAKNIANESNYYEGDYWTYNSVKAFQSLFPYASEKQIRNALKHLQEEDLIKTGNFNKSSYDRTLWYAFTEKGKTILQLSNLHLPKRENGSSQKGEPIPYNKPNIKPDNTTTKVVEQAPETFGNPDINDVFDEWERVCGFRITSKVKLNRYACQRLLKSRGKESIFKALPYVAESQTDKFAPNIVNFMDLEEKWNALGVWYKKKYITNFNKNGKITI